jgi:hypothetical protein
MVHVSGSGMSTTRSIIDIINALGGTSAFGRIIEVKQSTASEMKRRGNIPVPYWPKIIAADPVEGDRITYDELVQAHLPENKTAEAVA